MIWFDGRSSDDFAVYVEHYPPRPIPERKTERVSVPGRSGDIIYIQDAYKNVLQSYDIYISAERQRLSLAAMAVANWLCAPGYRRLEDSYDMEVYRLAMFTGGVSLANTLNMFGRATVTFDCMPQRWLKMGEYTRRFDAAGTLINPTGMTALPLITVRGKGAGTLIVGGKTLKLTDCNGITLDCSTQNAYRGTSNLNNTVTGSFPALGAGKSSISFSGGVTAVDIVPRWWSL